MPSKKDPNNVISGTGRAGSNSVGPNALTFEVSSGVPSTAYFQDLFVLGNLRADTGTFTSYVATNVIQPESGTSVSVDGNFEAQRITATDTSEGLRAFVISRPDGTNSDDITVLANVVLSDGGTDRNLTAGDLTANGSLNVTGTSTLGGNVDAQNDVGVGGDANVTGNANITGNVNATDVTASNSVSGNDISSSTIVTAGSNVEAVSDVVASSGTDDIGLIETSQFAFNSLQTYETLTESDELLDIGQKALISDYDELLGRGDITQTLINGLTYPRAVSFDGSWLHVLFGSGEAAALDPRDMSSIHNYLTGDSWDSGVPSEPEAWFSVTNGDYVAFVFGTKGPNQSSSVEVFRRGQDINDTSNKTVEWYYQQPTLPVGANEGRNIHAAYMNNEHLFMVVQEFDVNEVQLWKVALDSSGADPATVFELELPDLSMSDFTIRMDGYGDKLVIAYDDGIDVRLTRDGSLVGSSKLIDTGLDNTYVKTDGEYIYLGRESSGTGLQSMVLSFKNQAILARIGDDTDHLLTYDHRNIYILYQELDPNALEIWDRTTLSLKERFLLDAKLTNGLITEMTTEGQSLFLWGQPTLDDDVLLKLTLQQTDSVYQKVDITSETTLPRYHRLLPISGKASGSALQHDEVEADTVKATNELLAQNAPVAITQIFDSTDPNALSAYNVDSVTQDPQGDTSNHIFEVQLGSGAVDIIASLSKCIYQISLRSLSSVTGVVSAFNTTDNTVTIAFYNSTDGTAYDNVGNDPGYLVVYCPEPNRK